MGRRTFRARVAWCGMVLMLGALAGPPVRALELPLPSVLGDAASATLNTTFTAGVGVRTQSPNVNLIAKGDLDPNVCQNPPYQSCQGLFRTQVFPAQKLVGSPGSYNNNLDRGDLNYGRGELFQAPIKLSSDLTLKYGDFGLFGRALYFYDVVNRNFTEYSPNRITPDNVAQVGRLGSTLPIANAQVGSFCASNNGQSLIALLNSLGASLPAGSLPTIVPNLGSVCGRFYGPGGVVYAQRSDPEVLRQIGSDLQYLDSYLYGKLPLWGERELHFKLGRQLVNWGESTTLILNSINSSNPINANNFYRVGNQIEEDFVPINMIDLNADIVEGLTLEGYYQLEWKPLEAPAPGSYFSDIGVGTNNAGRVLSFGFGQFPIDEDCLGKLGDNVLTALAPTCSSVQRLPDWEPRTAGQFGLKLNWYVDDLNDGTDLGFYVENYHSRLPYASFFAAYPSCARAEGNALGNNATSLATMIQDCPDFPLLHQGDARQGTSSLLQVDTTRFVLEYPENIHLFGLSFNTTVGNYALQGEVAYRPNKPMQVDAHDLGFAALGAQITRCGQPGVQCEGTSNGRPGVGFGPNGETMTYGSSDSVNAAGQVYTSNTFNAILAGVPGGQRSFPNFVIPHRGGTVGENTPCYPAPGSADEAQHGFSGFSHPYYAYNRNSPCYIQGYERMHDLQFNLGATRVYGVSDNLIGADQVILIYELGAEYIPGFPALDQLVLQGPNTGSGPTAGADGSGADLSRRACSTTPDCSYGPDGVRFNPHQQDPAGYPSALSWGYRIVALTTYEQILPRITLKPFILFSHDVGGISPGPAGNFIKGRKSVNALFEFRYQQSLSLGLGYQWFWGGGVYNTLSDRDYAQAFIKYQF